MNYREIPAILLADAPGLDFLNSLATPIDEPIDWIADGEGLLSWLEQAEFVPVDVIRRVRAEASSADLDELAAKARDLREWFRAFVQKRKGRALSSMDLRELEPLNRALERDEQHGEIVVDETGFALRMRRRWPTSESLLMPIVEALAKLVCEEDFAQVKACEGPACTLLFADHTRGHARRWCSMAICGNRAKVAAHRKRVKEGARS
ncbi:CGNR zinc finger domain-containing protein [Caballeronia humi]|uniref:PF07336 family protein n=1 Tax=Caballeronia humi TaxID=326474 RepID=A0A158G4N3_9BURK|nr:ABATE domain-containing protein [Caballeronia humi]SAL27098.1 PF07336 family protein [Caballeronia humi]